MIRYLLVISMIICSVAAYADSFDDFKNQSMGEFEQSKSEFDTYKADIEKEFETYKKIIDKELADYKNSISKYWADQEVSDNKKWVEYLNDYRIRKVVDFEKEEIRIDVIGGTEADLKPVLKDMLKEDKGTAFRRDPVAYNTEKQIREQLEDVKTDKIEDEPVLADIITDKKRLTDSEADKVAIEMIAAGDKKIEISKTGQHKASVTIKLPKDTYSKAAKKIMPYVETYAEKFKMDTSLVMSVIYNESRFNPLAKSYVPAYGLMQIVPKSAGADVTQFLEGKKRILAPSYLYNAENNVRTGTAYLHIVYYRYFKSIKDPESRLYCSIAAYNTGAGNVAYAFNKNNGGRYSISKAAPVINSLSPRQVYEHLKFNLRYEEARNYIVNVAGKMKDY